MTGHTDDTSVLPALIERLEKATEPDRELDLAIVNIGAKHPWRWLDVTAETITRDEYGPGAVGNPVCSLEHFTASIDDALMLAPKDSAIGIAIYLEDNPDNELGRYRATIMPPLTMQAATDVTVYAASLPLAICIAALKAGATR